MAESAETHLRVYCICGQKMRVSAKMYGLPGKCVACRQKIRIPRPDEIGEGVTEIYLKDHPEFLRKPGRSRGRGKRAEKERGRRPQVRDEERVETVVEREGEDAGAVAVAEKPREAALEEDGARVSTVPLDVLEPLRNVCSVQYKLERRLESLGAAKNADRAELEGALARLRRVRQDLDEQLRQMLMEVAIELATTQEKIVQTGLSGRLGEVPYPVYRETMDRLRRRRDRLEKRQHNLRGWLATRDPHLAGGYLDLPVDAIPEEGFTITLPSEPDETDALLNQHLSALRDALHRLAQANRKLAEMDRMEREASSKRAGRGFKEARADCRAERKMAKEGVAFYRERLRQLSNDYNGDVQVADAQTDLARGRLQVGEITRSQFDGIEAQLREGKTDAAKARDLIRRSLQARAADELPYPRGSFLGRLALSRGGAPVELDSWIAWVAALLMGLSIFLPSVGNLSLVGAFIEFGDVTEIVRWAFLGPVIFGAAVALAAGIPDTRPRGRVLAVVWVVGTALGAYMLQQAQYGIDPISERFRVGPHWLIRPGLLVLVLADVGALAAVGIGLAVLGGQRVWFAGTVAAGSLAVLLAFTDTAGLFVPRPTVAVQVDEGGATVSVANQGRRGLHLMARGSDARGAYLYTVERRVGPASWSSIGDTRTALSNGAVATIAPGSAYVQRLQLTPGDFRVTLRSGATGVALTESFTVVGPPAPPEPPAPTPSPEPPASGTVVPLPPAPVTPAPPAEARLSGVFSTQDGQPRFSFIVADAEGTERRVVAGLGQELYDGWIVTEYNPDLLAVTLARDGALVVLRTGERGTLAP